jgi:hypothetical protein
MFQKNWRWVNQYDSFKKKTKWKTYEHTHELINMNHTNIPIITLCEPEISKGVEGMLRFMKPLNIWCIKTENREEKPYKNFLK